MFVYACILEFDTYMCVLWFKRDAEFKRFTASLRWWLFYIPQTVRVLHKDDAQSRHQPPSYSGDLQRYMAPKMACAPKLAVKVS